MSNFELNPHEASPAPTHSTVAVDDADISLVLRALALAWTPRHRNWLIALLRSLGCRTVSGNQFAQPQVDACLLALAQREEVSRSEAGWQCLVRHKVQRYREAIQGPDFERWRDALMHSEGLRGNRSVVYFQRDNQAITLARLIVYGGGSVEQWRSLETGYHGMANSSTVLDQVLLSGFDAELFDRADRSLAAALLSLALHVALRELDPNGLAPLAYARRWIDQHGAQAPSALRSRVIEWLMFRAETDAAAHLVELTSRSGALSGEFLALRAAVQATRGEYADAVLAYDQAFAQLKLEVSARKALGPENSRWLYLMCLFASRDAAQVALARKFALNESGSRKAEVDSPWGLWAVAAEIRLGDRPRDPTFASFNSWHASHTQLMLVARRMLQAWAAAGHPPLPNPGSSQALSARLRACELWWLADQVEAADQVLAGRQPATRFFAAGGHDAWREALAAIAALGTDRSTEGAAAVTDSRLMWVVSVDRHHRLTAIEPYEQKRGPRGWGKAKSVALSRLARAATLDPLDARVARAIKTDRRYGTNRAMLDLMDAAISLVGHPRVVMDDDLDRPITLIEALPDIRVVEEGDGWSFRFEPDLRFAFDRKAVGDDHDALHFGDDAGRAPESALRTQFVLREKLDQGGPTPISPRVLLIRLTPAHRRVFELAQSGLKIPRTAATEIQSVLPVLGAHFRLKADASQGATQVDADASLRAEMTRRGDRIGLRLVAAPLGPGGPRFAPGQGREDVLAMVDGRMLSSRRSLASEHDALREVIEQFEFLDPPGEEPSFAGGVPQPPDWTLADPQQALMLVETLPTLPVIAGIDWPDGQAVKVLAPFDKGLKVKVRTEGHWFTLEGKLPVDETRVLELGRLIEWVGQHRSRFVPIGDNTYVALTDSLRQRIEDLAAVTERSKGRSKIVVGDVMQVDAAGAAAGADDQAKGGAKVRVPEVAVLWLSEALENLQTDADFAFIDRIERLRNVQTDVPELPAALQTELRPYQLEGFEWIIQRARAGVGACLADDMGLGKTIQSLAVLLSRAAEGPSLVVAPTSVCSNWVDEAGRFAPSLKVRWYSGESAERLSQAGPFDVIVVSYTILQQAEERFLPVDWATLIVDEAQAVKNASAKRTQTVAALDARFRLALSGTPIENRLSELWSIMNIVNPGLLGSSERFADRFVVPIERNRDLRAQRTLRRLIGPFVLRRTKAQVLDDLPPRTEVTLTVTPTPEEAAYYEALRREALSVAREVAAGGLGAGARKGAVRKKAGRGPTPAATGTAAPADATSATNIVPTAGLTPNANQARFHVLAQLTRLRRAACDPRLVDPELAIGGAKIPAFIELVTELVANHHKALVFSQFVDFLGLLKGAIEQAGIRYQYLDGSTPAHERQQRVDAFQRGEGDLFLISLKAGGFGLNLTAADYVVIVDPWWNPAAEDQAMGRAHRIGQKRPVTVYRLVSERTIEQRIVDLHHDKRSLADGILEDIDSSAAPSITDLVGLLDD